MRGLERRFITALLLSLAVLACSNEVVTDGDDTAAADTHQEDVQVDPGQDSLAEDTALDPSPDTQADPVIDQPADSVQDLDIPDDDPPDPPADTMVEPPDTTVDTAIDTPPVDTSPEDSAQDPDVAPDTRDTTPVDSDAVQDWEDDGETPPPIPEPTQEGLIIAVDDTMWTNLDDLLFDSVQDSYVSLYVTLLDANFYNREERRAVGLAMIREPESFFANAVIPFLERYESTASIWAVDCLNEPEAMITGSTGNWAEWGVTWEEMRAYLSYCADVVHLHSSALVSAGSGWHSAESVAAGRFSGLGFDFLDHHYYDDEPSLPPASSYGLALPIVIGECGQRSDTWDDDLQLYAVRQCFAQAEAGGYLAAFSWYYNYAGSTNHHSHLNADGSWRPVREAFDEYYFSSLLVGTNLAWFSGAYDHDIGLNALHPSWGVAYSHEMAAAVIDDLDAEGVYLLRLWLFEGQEGLRFHTVFSDFEDGTDGWAASNDGVTLRTSRQHAADGEQSLVVHIEADQAGWYGITHTWSELTRLNLVHTASWHYTAHNDLGIDVGVNLALTSAAGDGPTTYQTRSGADGGQLWLNAGQTGEKSVTLAAGQFADQWALNSAPSVGVTRPADETMQRIEKLHLRVYLSQEQLPLSGDLYIDAVRIE